MSDTPRTNTLLIEQNYIGDELVPASFARQLELELNEANKTIRLQHELMTTAEKRGVDKAKEELNAANERIKRLEKELTDTKRKQSVLVSDVVLYEDRGERIKQMEEVGDEMLNWLTDDGISMENLRLIANAWRKAKEAKL